MLDPRVIVFDYNELSEMALKEGEELTVTYIRCLFLEIPKSLEVIYLVNHDNLKIHTLRVYGDGKFLVEYTDWSTYITLRREWGAKPLDV